MGKPLNRKFLIQNPVRLFEQIQMLYIRSHLLHQLQGT